MSRRGCLYPRLRHRVRVERLHRHLGVTRFGAESEGIKTERRRLRENTCRLARGLVIANARLSTWAAAATVVTAEGDVSVNEAGATQMLSRTIDVDDLKVFRLE